MLGEDGRLGKIGNHRRPNLAPCAYAHPRTHAARVMVRPCVKPCMGEEIPTGIRERIDGVRMHPAQWTLKDVPLGEVRRVGVSVQIYLVLIVVTERVDIVDFFALTLGLLRRVFCIADAGVFVEVECQGQTAIRTKISLILARVIADLNGGVHASGLRAFYSTFACPFFLFLTPSSHADGKLLFVDLSACF